MIFGITLDVGLLAARELLQILFDDLTEQAVELVSCRCNGFVHGRSLVHPFVTSPREFVTAISHLFQARGGHWCLHNSLAPLAPGLPG